MSAESDLYAKFMNYGDIITAYVVAQSVAFGYALGNDGSLKDAIVHGHVAITAFLVVAAALYSAGVWYCGQWEVRLRRAGGDSKLVETATRGLVRGRQAIITLFSLMTILGLWAQIWWP